MHNICKPFLAAHFYDQIYIRINSHRVIKPAWPPCLSPPQSSVLPPCLASQMVLILWFCGGKVERHNFSLITNPNTVKNDLKMTHITGGLLYWDPYTATCVIPPVHLTTSKNDAVSKLLWLVTHAISVFISCVRLEAVILILLISLERKWECLHLAHMPSNIMLGPFSIYIFVKGVFSNTWLTLSCAYMCMHTHTELKS